MNKCILRIFIFLLLITINSQTAFSVVSIGGFVPTAGSIQSDEHGNQNFTSFVGMASLNYKFKLFSNYDIVPEFSITLPVSGESEHTRQYIIYSLYFGKEYSNLLYLRGGLSTINQTVSHSSETFVLNNGDSFSTYYGVDGSYTASTSGLAIGLDSPIFSGYDKIKLKLDFHVQNLFTPTFLKIYYLIGLDFDFSI